MALETAIEWADDTASFWEGCTQISPACDFCYAKARAELYKTVAWNGPPRKVKAGITNLRLSNMRGKDEKRVRTVFINSLSDTFDNNAPEEWRRELFDAIKASPWVHALILTKRIGNAVEMSAKAGGFPANASLGSTMVNQPEIDRDLDKLRGAVNMLGVRYSFLSIEPMLGSIVLPDHVRDWLTAAIVGGESGRHARPMHPAWVRALRDQCAALCVSMFFKQWGEWRPPKGGEEYSTAHGNAPIKRRPPAFIVDKNGFCHCYQNDDTAEGAATMLRVGKTIAGRKLDGRTHDAFLPIDRTRAAA